MRTTTLLSLLLAAVVVGVVDAETRQPKIFFSKAWHPSQFGKVHVVKKHKGWAPRHKGWGWQPKGWGESSGGKGWSSWTFPKKSFGLHVTGGVGFSFGGKKKHEPQHQHHHHQHNHGWGWDGWGWKDENKGWGWDGWDGDYDDDVHEDEEYDDGERGRILPIYDTYDNYEDEIIFFEEL